MSNNLNKTILYFITTLAFSLGFLCLPMSGQAALLGDLNSDNQVDVMDLGIMLSNWNSTSRPASDLNQDGRVDVVDLGILLGNWGKTETASGRTINARSAAYADVKAAVDSATYGDTVIVPATPTFVAWSSELLITKNITLQGAGSGYPSGGATWIKQTINNSRYFLINYEPDATTIANDGFMRITGFKLDNVNPVAANTTANSSGGIRIYSAQTTRAMRFRVDNCAFYNFYKTDYTQELSRQYASAVVPTGWWQGVIDSNYLYNTQFRANGDPPYGAKSFTTWYTTPGNSNAIYFEDNKTENPSNALPNVAQGGVGGKYVGRFNDLTQHYSMTFFSGHNNQGFVIHPDSPTGTGKRGMSLCEVYQNRFERADAVVNYTNTTIAGAASGQWVTWGNRRVGNVNFKVSLAEADGLDDTADRTAPTVVLRNGVFYECILNHTSSAGNGPPNATYWKTGPWQTIRYVNWNTGHYYVKSPAYDTPTMYAWDNLTGNGILINATESIGSEFMEPNRDFWNYNASFNGTSGMGVGTKQQMLAITNPNPGVGFWVTNEGTWNHSNGNNVTDYAGQGVLYRANASRQWEKYYEPYTYPHPLRNTP